MGHVNEQQKKNFLVVDASMLFMRALDLLVLMNGVRNSGIYY